MKIYRGTLYNPKNRFFDIWYEKNFLSDKKTTAIEINVKSVITKNNSPDIPYKYTLNPYRGCEHGCVYCYARPYHEFLSESSGLDFESRIYVKINAHEVLKKELAEINFSPVHISGITDPYQPLESKYKITRKCLEVFREFNSPVSIITKNYLVTRDIDILRDLSRYNAVSVVITITTLSEELRELLEPRTSKISMRLKAIEQLAKNNIPVGVMIAPVIPGLTEHQIPEILLRARNAGASFAGYSLLRLPYKVKDIFIKWLEKNFPYRKNKIINSLKSIRSGKLTDSSFYTRFIGEGNYSKFISQLFDVFFKKYGYKEPPELKSPDLFS